MAITLKGSGQTIVQVVQSTLTSSVAGSSASFVSILTGSITPTSSSNKILVMLCASMGTGTTGNVQCQILRNGTQIFMGDASSNRTQVTGMAFDAMGTASMFPMSINYVDSPSTTSAITYDFKLRNPANAAYTFYVNRSEADNDANYRGRGATSLILMEISTS